MIDPLDRTAMTSNRPGTRLAVFLATWTLGLSFGLGAAAASPDYIMGKQLLGGAYL